MLRYLYPLLGIDEVGGNVDDPYHNMVLLIVPEHADDHCCCSNCSSVLVSLFSLFPLFFRVKFLLFPVKLVCCWIWKFMTLCLGYLSVLFKYGEKFLVLMKILLLLSISEAWGASEPSKCFLSLLPFPSGNGSPKGLLCIIWESVCPSQEYRSACSITNLLQANIS